MVDMTRQRYEELKAIQEAFDKALNDVSRMVSTPVERRDTTLAVINYYLTAYGCQHYEAALDNDGSCNVVVRGPEGYYRKFDRDGLLRALEDCSSSASAREALGL